MGNLPFEAVMMPDNRMHETHPIIAMVEFTVDRFNPLSFSFAGFEISIDAVFDGGWSTVHIGIKNDSHEIVHGCLLELYTVRGEKQTLHSSAEIESDYTTITFRRVQPDRYRLVVNSHHS